MALPPEEQLKELVRLKAGLRWTDSAVAAHFDVSPRTIQRWLRETAYGEAVEQFKLEKRDDAKARLAHLADDVVTNMYDLMTSASSGLVRFNAAKTLGEWIGLADLGKKETEDNRDEVMTLLRNIATSKASPIYLPPPAPGGQLPVEFVEGVVVEDEEEKKSEEPVENVAEKNDESGDGVDLLKELALSKERFSD